MMNKEIKEWHSQRAKGIGGSEVAAILGKSDYLTNVDLWKIKTGRKKAVDISENERVIYGNKIEPILIEIFKLDYPEYELYTGKDKNNIVHPEFSFIRGSLDGLLTEIETGRLGNYEAKSALINNAQQLQKWSGQIPESYFIQQLQYFLIRPKAEFAKVQAKLDFAWERPSEIRIYHLERSDFEEDIEYIKQKQTHYWKTYVEADVEPPLLLPAL